MHRRTQTQTGPGKARVFFLFPLHYAPHNTARVLHQTCFGVNFVLFRQWRPTTLLVQPVIGCDSLNGSHCGTSTQHPAARVMARGTALLCGGPWVGISQLRSFQPIIATHAWKSNMWSHSVLGSLSHYPGNDWFKVI